MKKLILTVSKVLFVGFAVFGQEGNHSKKWYADEHPSGAGFSRDLSFEVRGKYERSAKKEKLSKAKLVSDLIPGYPTAWIENYISVEILATCNGRVMKAVSANYILNAAQKKIINSVDLGTEIAVNVRYKYQNPAIDHIDIHEMNVSMMIIPEIEAEYVGGYQQMRKYLKENFMHEFSETIPKQFQEGAVIFTVNEEGKLVNAKISRTSGDPKADKLLIEAIDKMPKWKPAQNSKGIKVKQEFEFSVGDGGC